MESAEEILKVVEKINDNKSGANTDLLEQINKKLDYVIETLKYGEGKY